MTQNDRLSTETHFPHLRSLTSTSLRIPWDRQPKSLRKKSGKKPGGQTDHPGSTLQMSQTPDTVIVHPVEHCQHCQHDLREVAALQVERRQVVDLPRQQRAGHRTPGRTEVVPCLSAGQCGPVS